jgi:hypothetical protein
VKIHVLPARLRAQSGIGAIEPASSSLLLRKRPRSRRLKPANGGEVAHLDAALRQIRPRQRRAVAEPRESSRGEAEVTDKSSVLSAAQPSRSRAVVVRPEHRLRFVEPVMARWGQNRNGTARVRVLPTAAAARSKCPCSRRSARRWRAKKTCAAAKRHRTPPRRGDLEIADDHERCNLDRYSHDGAPVASGTRSAGHRGRSWPPYAANGCFQSGCRVTLGSTRGPDDSATQPPASVD